MFQTVSVSARGYGSGGSTRAHTTPGSIAVGDLLVATACNRGTTTGPTAPAGWTTLNTAGSGTDTVVATPLLAYKVADSSDVAAADFTFGSTNTNNLAIAMAVLRSGSAFDSTAATANKQTGSTGTNQSAVAIGDLVLPWAGVGLVAIALNTGDNGNNPDFSPGAGGAFNMAVVADTGGLGTLARMGAVLGVSPRLAAGTYDVTNGTLSHAATQRWVTIPLLQDFRHGVVVG